MENVVWWGLPASVLILAVVELAKQVGFPGRYAGVLAAALGAAGGIVSYFWGNSEVAASIVNGLVAGLAAAGLWSTAKNAAGR